MSSQKTNLTSSLIKNPIAITLTQSAITRFYAFRITIHPIKFYPTIYLSNPRFFSTKNLFVQLIPIITSKPEPEIDGTPLIVR